MACVVLCHHPPDWLVDQNQVEDHFNKRAKIQLYGHKHRQRVVTVNETIRVYAGALHPPRNEDQWQPRYNLVVCWVEGTGDDRSLCVEVYQRAWHQDSVSFGPDVDADGEYPKVYGLPLTAWENTLNEDARHPLPAEVEAGSDDRTNKNRAATPREIVYRFFSLPHPRRTRLIVNLGLLREEDEGVADSELIRRVIQRAQLEDLLDQLLESIEAETASDQEEPDA